MNPDSIDTRKANVADLSARIKASKGRPMALSSEEFWNLRALLLNRPMVTVETRGRT